MSLERKQNSWLDAGADYLKVTLGPVVLVVQRDAWEINVEVEDGLFCLSRYRGLPTAHPNVGYISMFLAILPSLSRA